jgi:hypothetical protein
MIITVLVQTFNSSPRIRNTTASPAAAGQIQRVNEIPCLFGFAVVFER